MQFQSALKITAKASNKVSNPLTTKLTYSSVLLGTTEYQANHAKCSNTLHGSDPTLTEAVSGLQSIIQPRRIPVLRGLSSPTDSSIGVGCLVFRAEGR
jgi:hypothetical protein